MNNNNKKPVYKKWWFWVLALIVIGGIYSASQQSSNDATVVKTDQSNQTASKTTEQKTEFKVGETIAFDGKEVTVKTLDRNWKSDNQFITPKDGKEYVRAMVSIVNKSDSELSFNTFDWKIEDANGAIEGPTGAAFTDDAGLGSGELTAGGKKEGSVVFEVTKDSAVKIHYQPSFWSNKKIVIVP